MHHMCACMLLIRAVGRLFFCFSKPINQRRPLYTHTQANPPEEEVASKAQWGETCGQYPGRTNPALSASCILPSVIRLWLLPSRRNRSRVILPIEVIRHSAELSAHFALRTLGGVHRPADGKQASLRTAETLRDRCGWEGVD